ncbi:MmcQ/YjbR family DNA-binding protein [Paracoccaceae bacterium GXU_MW_L88]
MKARLQTICETLPGAVLDHPWDDQHDAWKIGDKMFAVIGAKLQGVSVKCSDVETAQMLIDAGVARKAPYFHQSWVQLPPETEDEELRHRVLVSYDVIRSALPKKTQSQWPQREEI